MLNQITDSQTGYLFPHQIDSLSELRVFGKVYTHKQFSAMKVVREKL